MQVVHLLFDIKVITFSSELDLVEIDLTDARLIFLEE